MRDTFPDASRDRCGTLAQLNAVLLRPVLAAKQQLCDDCFREELGTGLWDELRNASDSTQPPPAGARTDGLATELAVVTNAGAGCAPYESMVTRAPREPVALLTGREQAE
jgi:hypothetical protein